MDKDKGVVIGQTEEGISVEEQVDENEALLDSQDSEAEEELTEEEKKANEVSEEEPALDKLLKRQDVKEFLRKVRQQEKTKLYDAIEKKDAKIRELSETVSTLERTIASYKEGKDTTIADLKVEIDGLKNKLEDAEKARAEKALELYREKAIQFVRDSGSDLIEDLVVGSSEEEIDSSIEKAKAKYEEIVARASGRKEKKPAPKPVAPQQDAGARKLTTEDIMKMSPSEYAKHREEIKKMIK